VIDGDEDHESPGGVTISWSKALGEAPPENETPGETKE